MIEIPRQFKDPKFRFISCGKWDEYKKNRKGEEQSLAKVAVEKGWNEENNYTFDSCIYRIGD